jgi:general secretion pathway protein K
MNNSPLAVRRQRGLALVTAVLIVAIVSTLAAYLGLGQQVRLRQAQNLADRAQADAVARAVYQWAAVMLEQDARTEKIARDDLTEEWATALAPIPVDGGEVQARIADAQGRFNLNNLVRGGTTPSQPDIGVFRRLLQSQGLNPALTEAVVDWLDSDGQVRPAGAEDIEYLQLDPPYRAANRPFESAEELRLVRGFDAEAVQKLRPYVIALPVATTININTAPAAVLSALFVNLPLSSAEQLVAARAKLPFSQTAELAARAGQAPVEGVQLSVKSSYFIVVAETRFGRLARRAEALIFRGGGSGQTARLLWQASVL